MKGDMTYKKHYQALKRKIQKDYGKSCVDFDIDCYVCRAYLLLDILRDVCELDT